MSASACTRSMPRLSLLHCCKAHSKINRTRRPASADRTARRQFQATGQPVSRTQASVTMTSRLLRYEAKCVQRRCFQCGSDPLRSDIKGTELPLPISWYHSKGNWLRYNFAAESFYILLEQVWKTESHWRIMEAIHSAPKQSVLLSTLLQQVSFDDVQALTRLNVIHYERDQRQPSELVVTFRSKLTCQVFDEIRHSYSRRRARWRLTTSSVRSLCRRRLSFC